MNSLKPRGNWLGPAGKIKQQFSSLDNLTFPKGKEEEKPGRLQNYLVKTNKELRKIISKL